jgi:hypothetical protein
LRLQLGWPIPNSLSDTEASDRAGAIEKHPFERGTGPPVILRVGRRWMRFDRGTMVPLAHQSISPREENPTLSTCSTARIAVRHPRCRASRPASQRGNLAQHRRPRASISSSSTTLRAPQPLTLPLRRPRAPHPPTTARQGRVLLLVGLTSFCGGAAGTHTHSRDNEEVTGKDGSSCWSASEAGAVTVEGSWAVVAVEGGAPAPPPLRVGHYCTYHRG